MCISHVSRISYVLCVFTATSGHSKIVSNNACACKILKVLHVVNVQAHMYPHTCEIDRSLVVCFKK